MKTGYVGGMDVKGSILICFKAGQVKTFLASDSYEGQEALEAVFQEVRLLVEKTLDERGSKEPPSEA